MQLTHPNQSNASNQSGKGLYGCIKPVRRPVSILLVGHSQTDLVQEATKLGWLKQPTSLQIRFATIDNIDKLAGSLFDRVLWNIDLSSTKSLDDQYQLITKLGKEGVLRKPS
ncbi:hypothetical protein LIN78_13220 [Leeia sp. TBRC 13508]|uniref:Uncharacterized protein n=1 Tax=Leeia speluncae TaxID=2884804 RepID=A0ABS8DA72_9NEIS|nr:hypothetical protein [Leeia speluncae]MCB6184503.1 hypothetical protein [Leeia speluncae]